MKKNWEQIKRNGEIIWVNTTKPVWIVKYDAIKNPGYARPMFYQAYRAIHAVPQGRKCWSVDNRRVFGEYGVRTLSEAKRAV